MGSSSGMAGSSVELVELLQVKIIQAHSEVAAKVVAKIVIDKYEKNNIDIYCRFWHLVCNIWYFNLQSVCSIEI